MRQIFPCFFHPSETVKKTTQYVWKNENYLYFFEKLNFCCTYAPCHPKIANGFQKFATLLFYHRKNVIEKNSTITEPQKFHCSSTYHFIYCTLPRTSRFLIPSSMHYSLPARPFFVFSFFPFLGILRIELFFPAYFIHTYRLKINARQLFPVAMIRRISSATKIFSCSNVIS